MPSSGSECPENGNSTDCLLRTLVVLLEQKQNDDDKQFNWDPITFGFTVAIALAAATFAFVTIVQASLAAGSGRLKSDKRAIGRWAIRTKWEWHWLNMSFIHKTTTPVLKSGNILEVVEMVRTDERRGTTRPGMFIYFGGFLNGLISVLVQRRIRASWVWLKNLVFRKKEGPPAAPAAAAGSKDAGPGYVLRFFVLLLSLPLWFLFFLPVELLVTWFPVLEGFAERYLIGDVDGGSSASWVRYLGQVGLGDISPARLAGKYGGGSGSGSSSTKVKIADSLPGDVIAVPADAEVGVLITLLAVRGPQKWSFGATQRGELPTVVGLDYQFEFRHHPYLGVVGVFLEHGQAVSRGGTTKPSPPDSVILEEALYHARGVIWPASYLLLRREGVEEVGDGQGVQEQLPVDEATLNLVYFKDATEMLRSHRAAEGPHCTSCTGFPYIESSEDTNRLSTLLYAAVPGKPPAIYPWAHYRASELLVSLSMSSAFWNTRKLFIPRHGHAMSRLRGGGETGQRLWGGLEQSKICQEAGLVVSGHRCRCHWILESCSYMANGNMGEFDRHFNALPLEEMASFRQNLLDLAKVVDLLLRRLHSVGEGSTPSIRCRLSGVITRAGALLELDRACVGDAQSDVIEVWRDYAEGAKIRRERDRPITEEEYRKDRMLQDITGHLTGSTIFESFRKLDSSVLPELEKSIHERFEFHPPDEYNPSDGERVVDVFIFRALLVALLFYTAPDNSRPFGSGAWGHIVPVL